MWPPVVISSRTVSCPTTRSFSDAVSVTPSVVARGRAAMSNGMVFTLSSGSCATLAQLPLRPSRRRERVLPLSRRYPMGYRVAVVGATGNVGREMLSILEELSFPVDKIHAIASRKSIGIDVGWKDGIIKCEDVEQFDFSR